MSTQADEAPAPTFAFPTRRFACDRCRRSKLKCDRAPLIMTPVIATALGPCKRCGTAGVECTNSSATTSISSTHEESAIGEPSLDITKNTHKRSSLKPASSSTASSNDLGSFSPFGRSVVNNVEPFLTDSAQLLDIFDFDLSAVDGESEDHFNTSSGGSRGLLPPGRSWTTGSTEELEGAERTRYSARENMDQDEPAFSDLLSISSKQSLIGANDHPLSIAAEPTRPSSPLNPFMETLNRLSKLQIFIFKEFERISKENLAKTFLSPRNGLSRSLRGASQDSDLVEKLLYASERLIDILMSCGRNKTDSPSAPSAARFRNDGVSGSKRTYSNLLDGEELLRADMSDSASFRLRSPTADTLTNQPDFMQGTSADTPNVRPPSQPKSTGSARFDPPTSSSLLSPAKLTLLVCYVSLLGVYRSILIQGFKILGTPPPPSPASRSRTPRCASFHTFTATTRWHSPQMSNSTILRFRIKLEMLTHT